MIPRPRSWQIVLIAACALVIAARWFVPVTSGLRMELFETADWSGVPGRDVQAADISLRSTMRAWVRQPDVFSARWSGYLVVAQAGTYTFSLTSDDGSRLRIGETLVIDNGGNHAAQTKTAQVPLERGTHPITLEYHQAGGAAVLDLQWAQGDGELAALPSWAMAPHEISPTTVAAIRWLERLFVPALVGLGLLFVWILFPARLT
jgi:hypothetical protein